MKSLIDFIFFLHVFYANTCNHVYFNYSLFQCTIKKTKNPILCLLVFIHEPELCRRSKDRFTKAMCSQEYVNVKVKLLDFWINMEAVCIQNQCFKWDAVVDFGSCCQEAQSMYKIKSKCASRRKPRSSFQKSQIKWFKCYTTDMDHEKDMLQGHMYQKCCKLDLARCSMFLQIL